MLRVFADRNRKVTISLGSLAKNPHFTNNRTGFSISVMSEEELFEPLKSYLTKRPPRQRLSPGPSFAQNPS
jgi:hypothetical protein